MKLFVSYQRADTAVAAHALAYALRLGGHEVFVDTGSIGVGELYRQVIANAVSSCNLVFALIGPAFDARRLHEPTSVVAYEWQRARFHGLSVVPVLVDSAAMPAQAQLPPALRWFTRRNALPLRSGSFSADIGNCVAAVPTLADAPRRAARVLWVDDRPANNEHERKWLRPHGLVFDSVVSTEEAVEQLVNESYDLVITDLGRESSSDRSATAGAAFLEQPIVRDGGPPVIVYAGIWAVARREALLGLGALEVTDNREQLCATVLEVLGRSPPPADELHR
ncbi:MAG TPA: TIR domain-containing protein [Rubrivivax sp.]|nr:TIR domain-containing protein [Rubrivivax sp.]